MDETDSVSEETLRGKAIQLLRYLEAFVQLRLTVVRDVEKYRSEGAVIWFGEMPQATDCRSPLWTKLGQGREDVWLEIKKQTLPDLPPLPEKLRPWADLKELQRSDGPAPRPCDEISVELGPGTTGPTVNQLVDHP